MGFFLPLIAIVAGLLAATSVITQKLPDAASYIEKIRPYEATIGAASLCMSLFSVFSLPFPICLIIRNLLSFNSLKI